ncbi:MAG TPA: matrixin family metalloprotease, partial [Planctomycetota bacterium]|nr:matrixin family metalloprotease [Planctomycetota bacterium]
MSHRLPTGLLALSALGFAALLLIPSELAAFTTTGESLGVLARDVRVFNNFADPEANDNVTPHPNWPGATGATLAIWKGVAEWSSRLHGDGSGDPSQPGDVGSGGANFDVNWQGLAPDIGPIDGNVVSAFSGCSGGMTTFVEFGPAGWRLRLCESVLWDDGPGTTLAPGAFDIQGLVAHEYGHILGLGHSNVVGSTMYPTVSGNGVAARSIEADDRAG